MQNRKIIVIGAGPAGLMAGIAAAQAGARVTILEHNEKSGKKIYITGKGRCNLCNAAGVDEAILQYPRNGRFLFSAFYHLSPQDLMSRFEQWGLPLKTEQGNRVFPQSDKASDVTRTLNNVYAKSGGELLLNTGVKQLIIKEDRCEGVVLDNGQQLAADAVIIATGGASYPVTGSTGDGYRFAKQAGHTVFPAQPSLVPLVTKEAWPHELTGISLKNVRLTAYKGKKSVFSDVGEMLFTHFGVSGPLVLSASCHLADQPEGARLSIDLKPGLNLDKLDARLQRDLTAAARKQLATALEKLLPQRLLATVLQLSGLDGAKIAGQLSKQERAALCSTLKGLELTVQEARPLKEAIITRGGVNVKEVDPSTLRSKRTAGLYFAGEVLDFDGYTGGYNMQAAFATGDLAGFCAAQDEL